MSAITNPDWGRFTNYAPLYKHRPSYSRSVLKCLTTHVGSDSPDFRVADVGAGTGKLTETLAELGLKGVAIEPDDGMRSEGLKYLAGYPQFAWRQGSAEKTGMPDGLVNWVLMGTSLHWTDIPKALDEFYRILKRGGHFTAIWNLRDSSVDQFTRRVEDVIDRMAPGLVRVPAIVKDLMVSLEERLLSTKQFGNCIYIESLQEIPMSRDRFMGVWRSTHDIAAQTGQEKWAEILATIERDLGNEKGLSMKYRTHSWTVQRD